MVNIFQSDIEYISYGVLTDWNSIHTYQPVYISSTKSNYKFSNMYDGCFNHLYHHERYISYCFESILYIYHFEIYY